MKHLAKIVSALLLSLAVLTGTEGHVRADPPAQNPAASRADWWETLDTEAYQAAVENGTAPADVDLSRVPEAVRPVIKEYFSKMRESWTAFRGGLHLLTHNNATHLPREMIKFYLAVGIMEAWNAARSNDPTVFNAWIESLEDVHGHIGFVLFSMASGLVGKGLNSATGMNAAMQGVLRGGRGAVLGRQALSIGIGQIGMVAGMLVSNWYSELVNHEDVKGWLNSFKIKDPKRRNAIRMAYLESFKQKIFDGSRREKWLWDQVPHIESLLAAGGVSLGIKMGLSLGVKALSALAKAPRVVALAKRTYEASKVVRGVVLGLKVASTVTSFTPVGLLVKLGLWVGEAFLFVAADHLFKEGIQEKWDQGEGIKNLQRREGLFYLSLDDYMKDRDPEKLTNVHVRMLELERAWDAYRNIFMRKAQETYARHSKLIQEFDQHLSKIGAYYAWFARGSDVEELKRQTLELDYGHEDESSLPSKSLDDDEVAGELDAYLTGYFCGPDPAHAISRAEHIFNENINLPWNREDLYKPFKAFPDAAPHGFCDRASLADQHPLFDAFLKSIPVPDQKEMDRWQSWSWRYNRLGFRKDHNGQWAYEYVSLPKADDPRLRLLSETPEVKSVGPREFQNFLNANRLEFLANYARDIEKSLKLKNALTAALESAQGGEGSELRKRLIGRYYRIIQKSLLPALAGREPIIDEQFDRVEGFRGRVEYKAVDAEVEVYVSGDPDRETYLRWKLEQLERDEKLTGADLDTLTRSDRPRQLALLLEKAKAEMFAHKDRGDLSDDGQQLLKERVFEARDLVENWEAGLQMKQQELEFLQHEAIIIRRELQMAEREEEVEKTVLIPFPLRNAYLSQEDIRDRRRTQESWMKRLSEIDSEYSLLSRRESNAKINSEMEALRAEARDITERIQSYNGLGKRIYPKGVLPSFDMEQEFWTRLTSTSLPQELAGLYDEILRRVQAKRLAAQTLANYAIYPNPDWQTRPNPSAAPSVKMWEHVGSIDVIRGFDQYLMR